jgi:hypothetical protein
MGFCGFGSDRDIGAVASGTQCDSQADIAARTANEKVFSLQCGHKSLLWRYLPMFLAINRWYTQRGLG